MKLDSIQNKEKKDYPAVDLCKFICCLLIIAIHTKPFANNFWLDAGVGLITRFAVPYFFVASGFFFFLSVRGKTKEEQNQKLLHYELRLLRFYSIWFIIQNVQGIIRGYVYSPLYYIRHFILPNNGSILWFIPALMFAVFIAFELRKVCSDKIVLLISLIIWIVGYSFTTIAPLFPWDRVIAGVNSAIGIQNGLFFGFPYIALSCCFTTKETNKKNIRDILCILFFFVVLCCEAYFVVTKLHPSLTFLWLSALPLTYFTFHLTLNIDLGMRPVFMYMRKISTLVYVVHPIMLKIIQDMFSVMGVEDNSNLLLTFGVCATSIIVSYCIYRLSKRNSFAVLKYLM